MYSLGVSGHYRNSGHSRLEDLREERVSPLQVLLQFIYIQDHCVTYIHYMWLSLRYVYMVCEVSGASYEEILTDINEGGTRTPDFLEMNPQHTIPTLKAGSAVRLTLNCPST